MPVDGTIKLMMTGALLAATLAVGGCSTQIADLPAVGLPADAPPRPKEAGSYLPVHDLPPERAEAAMKPDEQKRIQAELLAARDRQASSGTPQNAPSR
jgi:hypothetical protein